MPNNPTVPLTAGLKLGAREIGERFVSEGLLVDSAGVDVVGAVAADPAANTVLGRLKAVAVALITLADVTSEILARMKATYPLGSALTLAANSGGAPVINVYSGSYIWTASTTGATIALQALGADGTTWTTIETIAAGGPPEGVVIAEGTSLRLFNPTNASVTASGKLG